MNTPYTYVFVRKDLSIPQQIVQSSHAALEAGFRFSRPNETSCIVLIGVDNQNELKHTSRFLSTKEIEHEMFFEPDYNTGYTAIATKPLFGKERNPLKKYKLHKGEGEEICCQIG